MRLQNEARNVNSNITATVQDFTIVANAKAFQVLTSNLYTDRPLAIVRELACNAIDAHKVAGISDTPITVQLPTQLSPTLRVIDRGPGMSEKKCMGLYTTVFDSDKTDSDEEIGGFGLGSKSPFSYTDTFTVISKHGGWKTTYTAFIQESGTPGLVKISEEVCDDTGVEIIVPVKRGDYEDFRAAAAKAFKFFDPFPNCPGLENNKPEYQIHTSLFGIRTESRQYGRENIHVVMGGVAYPLNSSDFPQTFIDAHRSLFLIPYKWDVFLPIGACDLAPSREALSLDKQSIRNLDKALTKIREELVGEVQRRLDGCETGLEAHIQSYILSRILKNLRQSPLTWGKNKNPVPQPLGQLTTNQQRKCKVACYTSTFSMRGRGVTWHSTMSDIDKPPTFIWLDEPAYQHRTWSWLTRNKNALLNSLPVVLINSETQEVAEEIVRDAYHYRSDVLVKASEKYPLPLGSSIDPATKKPITRKKTKIKRWTSYGTFTEADIVLDELDPNTTLWAEMDGTTFKSGRISAFTKYTADWLLSEYNVLGVPRTLKHLDKKMPGRHLSDFMDDVRFALSVLPSSIEKLQAHSAKYKSDALYRLASTLESINREFEERYPGRSLFNSDELRQWHLDSHRGFKILTLFEWMDWELPKYDSRGGYYTQKLEALNKKYPMLLSLNDYDMKHPGFWHYFDLVHAAEES